MRKTKGIIIALVIMLIMIASKVDACVLSYQEYTEEKIRHAYVVGEYILDAYNNTPNLEDFATAARSIKDEDIIFFEYGVPGFENMTQFVILGKTDSEDDPFFWLQSVQNPNLAFVIMNPRDLVLDYEAEIDMFTANLLRIKDENDALIYCIVTVPEDISKISINLKAPIIINAKENRGCQVVLENENYKFKHIITEEFVKA